MKGLYKGKRIDNGEWVEGFYWAKLDPCTLDNSFCNHFIHNGFVFENKIEVDPKTVSQATGLKDKNGKKIFEGDGFRIETSEYFGDFYVEYIEDACRYVLTNGHGYDSRNCLDLTCDTIYGLEIIGNIHDK